MTDRQLSIEMASLEELNELHALSEAEFNEVIPCLQAMKDLKLRLPKLINAYKTHLAETWEFAHLLRLQESLAVLESRAAYLFSLRSSGGQPKTWHALALQLGDEIEFVLKNTGRPRVSVKADGTLVKVLDEALYAALDYRYPPSTITSALRRTNRTAIKRSQPAARRKAVRKS